MFWYFDVKITMRITVDTTLGNSDVGQLWSVKCL